MTRKSPILISVLCILGLCGSVPAQVEWPGLRGPEFDGSAGDFRLFDDVPGMAIGWKRALGSGYSSVIVGHGRVVTMFAGGEQDAIAAFDVNSGDEIWRYPIGKTYAGHDGSHDGPISTPLLVDRRVYGLGPWGHLFALDIEDGRPIWATHVVDDHGGKKPHYGFATQPVLLDGVLVVEIGGEEGKAVAGFDAATGEALWFTGDDAIDYQSPIPITVGGKRQVMGVSGKRVFGIDPRTGRTLWSHEHGGDERAMGGGTIVPVPAGDGRYLLLNKMDSSVMIRVVRDGDDYTVSELWSSNGIRGTYVIPVYHDGHFYGMAGKIFTCIDAATGETRWKSRQPGDGFPTLVGDNLVIMTKPGTLHVAQASPDGYTELAMVELFEEHSWSEVAYADGKLFARSMGHLARIDPTVAAPGANDNRGWFAATAFGRFLADLSSATDRSAAIDAYLARQSSFPIVEGADTVHFVYRGAAEDVGIVGDAIGYRREDPMKRVAGTDLFHYSMRLEPDAAASYGFIVDYGDPIPDPRNDRAANGLFGDVSWFAMPAWRAPSFLGEAAAADRRGRLESVEWDSTAKEGQRRTAQVYLPAGYDAVNRRYPVAYVHAGDEALEQGRMDRALDHLIGTSVEPLIAVFIIRDPENLRGDTRGDEYLEMLNTELVPLIDARYATIPEATARASVGSGRAAAVALLTAFKHPELFLRAGTQSALIGADDLAELIRPADELPLVLYFEWGTYHMRSPHEAWDLAVENRNVWALLREYGHRPAGGEVPEGFTWPCWQAHLDELLEALFPRQMTGAG